MAAEKEFAPGGFKIDRIISKVSVAKEAAEALNRTFPQTAPEYPLIQKAIQMQAGFVLGEVPEENIEDLISNPDNRDTFGSRARTLQGRCVFGHIINIVEGMSEEERRELYEYAGEDVVLSEGSGGGSISVPRHASIFKPRTREFGLRRHGPGAVLILPPEAPLEQPLK